ncbi:MAG TPA: SH3 domain-containing protein [Chloroflexota bacterium]
MSDGLRTWLLSTIGGWLVALLLIYLGERGLVPPPPAGALLRLPDEPPPTALVPLPSTPLPDDALRANADPPGPPDEADESLAPALLVADPAGVNLRAEPSMTGAVIAVLPRGTVVEPEDEAVDAGAESGWRHVVWRSRDGWVADRLLQPATGP